MPQPAVAIVVMALLAGPSAAEPAPPCKLLDGSDRSVPTRSFYRTRLRFQCQAALDESAVLALAQREVERQRSRRKLDAVEVLVYGPRRRDVDAAPDAYALWAYRGRAEQPPPSGAAPSEFTYTIALRALAELAVRESPLNTATGGVSKPAQARRAVGRTSGGRTADSRTQVRRTAGARRPVGRPGVAPAGRTAAAANPATGLESKVERTLAEAQINLLLSRWLEAWQARDLDRYLAFYSPHFRTGFDAWRQRKRAAFRAAGSIRISISNIRIELAGDRAVVTFTQEYRSDRTSDNGTKTLELVREGDDYRIVAEDWSGS